MNARGMAVLGLAVLVSVGARCSDKGDTIVIANPGYVPAPGTLVGVSEFNTLIFFQPATPDKVDQVMPIEGISSGTLRCMDFRPSDGLLYGVDDVSFLYVINPSTGLASPVRWGAGTGTACAFDPLLDLLRIVNTTDTHVISGMSAGSTTNLPAVAYAIGDPNFGVDPSIDALAQTHQFVGASSTTIYAVDFGLDCLVTLDPTTSELTTVGPLGTDFTQLSGFDIAVDGTAYLVAAAAAGNTASLFTVNLGTGATTLVGTLPAGYEHGLFSLAVVP